MKIVFVCDTLGSGGAERVISTLSNEFINQGRCVSIIVLSKVAGTPFYKLKEGVDVHYLTKDIKQRISVFRKAKLLKRCIEDMNPDIVISFISYVCIYTWWALRKTKIPYIVSERNDPNQRPKIKQYLLNLSFKKSAGCVFQTTDAMNWYRRIVSTRTTVIYNPVNLDCNPKAIYKRKKQILYVGRFSEQKNLFMLIDAFKTFSKSHEDYVLKMYGSGLLKEAIFEYIKQNSLDSKVQMLSSSPKWQKNEADSRLFVLPSKYEGMPNVLAEALCLGIPSVSTNCTIGGPAELKKIFPNSLVLSEEISAESFYSAIEQGLLINKNVSGVPDELRVETIVNQWISFINSVITKEE